MARVDDAHGRERSQAGADGRPADANLDREIALRGQAIAGLERAALDEIAHVGHDLVGAVRETPVGRQAATRPSMAQSG